MSQLFGSYCPSHGLCSLHRKLVPAIQFVGQNRVVFTAPTYRVFGLQPGMTLKLGICPYGQNHVIVDNLSAEFLNAAGTRQNGGYLLHEASVAEIAKFAKKVIGTDNVKVFLKKTARHAGHNDRYNWHMEVPPPVVLRSGRQPFGLVKRFPYLADSSIPLYLHPGNPHRIVAPLDEIVPLGPGQRKNDPYRDGKLTAVTHALLIACTDESCTLPPPLSA